jgi:coenzyme F420-0:L-glutamate ligase / coenzyme F420-1:gamma-L-glutamate ligase
MAHSDSALYVQSLAGIPEVTTETDLPKVIAEALERYAIKVQFGDVLVVAQKIISKREGRVIRLVEITPSAKAQELALGLEKDPRLVELVLSESTEIIRAAPGNFICRTHHGFVCANAGIDASNVGGASNTVILLPQDPDASARKLRADLKQRFDVDAAIVISDSFGRPWRLGQVEVALGCAGIVAASDWRGLTDADDRPLVATISAHGDALASVTELVRSKNSHRPVTFIRGGGFEVTVQDGPGATSLIRPLEQDLFRRK